MREMIDDLRFEIAKYDGRGVCVKHVVEFFSYVVLLYVFCLTSVLAQVRQGGREVGCFFVEYAVKDLIDVIDVIDMIMI